MLMKVRVLLAKTIVESDPTFVYVRKFKNNWLYQFAAVDSSGQYENILGNTRVIRQNGDIAFRKANSFFNNRYMRIFIMNIKHNCRFPSREKGKHEAKFEN